MSGGMGISEDEIERELQTLRNLRRRSISSPGPGALAVDPDLPPPSPGSSSAGAFPSYTSNDDVTLATPDGLDDGSMFWVPAHLHPELAPGEFKEFLKAHTHRDPDQADASDAGSAPGVARSPSWLARNRASAAGRSSSIRSIGGGEGLGRKRSMLSRQYQPKHGDAIEDEAPPLPTGRQRGSIYSGRNGEKGLTLQDLQKLETLVDQVEETDDPDKMRSMLRRSLSMNVAPGFLNESIPEGQEENAPVVVPRPGSIIRRTARTRIRKSHLSGDGGGRRFGSSRRGRTSLPPDDGGEPSGSYSRRSSDENGSEEAYSYAGTGGSIESHEYEERFQDAQEYQGGPQIDVRRGSDDRSDDGGIFDAYRKSRSSSVDEEEFGDGWRSVSDESSDQGTPASSSSALGLATPTGPERQKILPKIVPSYSSSSSSGGWFSEEGEKTPTQESISDPLAGLRRPSPGADEARPGLRLPSGMNLGVPVETMSPNTTPIGRTASLPALGQTTPQSRPGILPPSSAGEVDLLPGMAPPATRQSLPPGIALQHQRSHENLGASPIDSRPPLNRADSSTPPPSSQSAKEKEKDKEREREKEKKGGFFGKKDKKEKEVKEGKKKEKEGFLGSLFGGKKKQEESSSVANFATAGPAAAAALLGSSKSAKSIAHSPQPSPTSPGFNLAQFARYPIHVERAVYRLSHIKLANARRPLYEQVLISNLMFWYLGVIGRNVSEEKKANAEEKKEEPAKVTPKGTPPKALDGGQAGNGLPLRARDPETPQAQVPPPQQPQTTLKKSLTKPERRRDGRDNEAAVRTPQYGMQTAQVDNDIRASQAREARDAREAREARDAREGPMKGGPGQLSGQSPNQAAGPGMPRSTSGGSQQYQPFPPGAAPPLNAPGQPRTVSNPNPGPDPRQRALSPPQLASPVPGQPQQPQLRDLQGPPRGVPQSSFGPPPIQTQNLSPNPNPNYHGPQQGFDDRRSGDPRDIRQRTQSSPHSPSLSPGQHSPNLGPGSGSPNMRRVVTDGRTSERDRERQGGGGSSHAGPQPGQLFQYPGGQPSSPVAGQSGPAHPFPHRSSSHPAPGQIFSPPNQAMSPPGPGQIFHHAQQLQQHHSPPPQQHPHQSRPLPEAGGGGNPRDWPPQRLPPPQAANGPYHPHQHPHPQHQGQAPYDPRDPHRRPQPVSGYPAQLHPGQPGFYPPQPQQQAYPHGHPHGAPPGGFPQHPGGAPPVQVGQVFNGYPGGQAPYQGDYRRTQAVPGQYGAHHR